MSKVDKNDLNNLGDKILEKIGDEIITAARKKAVLHDSIATGELINSFFNIRVGVGERSIGNDVEWALLIEFGRNPSQKMPPLEKIKRWIQNKRSLDVKRVKRGGHYLVYYTKQGKGMITSRKWSLQHPVPKFKIKEDMAWAIAKKIQNEGFEARPFMRPAIHEILG